MKKVAIVYQSVYGNTAIVAQSIQAGLQSHHICADLIPVESVLDVNQLSSYDGMIFGAPTYMGSVPAQYKAFMDKTSSLWVTQAWADKLAAGFTNSGGLSGDKFSVLAQLHTFASQHSMLWMPIGIPCSGNQPHDLNRLGSSTGLMTQSNNGEKPPMGDLNTAEQFGQRFAQWIKKL